MQKLLNITLACVLSVSMFSALSAKTILSWKAIPFSEGVSYKHLVKTSDHTIWFFSAKKKDMLTANINGTTSIRVEAISKKEDKQLKVDLLIDKQKKTYALIKQGTVGKFTTYQPLSISVQPGPHSVQLLTKNQGVFFRVFKASYRKVLAPVALVKPTASAGNIFIEKNNKKTPYFIVTADKPATFTVPAGYRLHGFVRAALTQRVEPSFTVYSDSQPVLTMKLPLRKSKAYSTDTQSQLTIGRKVDLPAFAKSTTITIKSNTANPLFFRLFKDRRGNE